MTRAMRIAGILCFTTAVASSSACKQRCRSDTIFATLTIAGGSIAADEVRVWVGDNPASSTAVGGVLATGVRYELAFDEPYREGELVDLYAVALSGGQQVAGAHTRFVLEDTCSTATLTLTPPGAVAAEQSSIRVSKDPVRADGVDAATIEVRARDADGVPIAGATVERDDGSPPLATDELGYASFEVRSAAVEVRTVRVLVAGVELSAELRFIAFSKLRVTTGNTLPHADGVETATIEITLIDIAGDPIVGVVPRLAISGSGNTLSPLSATDSLGQSSTVLATTVAEEKEITLDVSDLPGLSVAFQTTVRFVTARPHIEIVAVDATPASTCWTIRYRLSHPESLTFNVAVEQWNAVSGGYVPIQPISAFVAASSVGGTTYDLAWETNDTIAMQVEMPIRVSVDVPGEEPERAHVTKTVDNRPAFELSSTGSGGAPFAVAVANLDGDEFLDLAIANSGSSNVSVRRGNGDGTFGAAVDYAAGGMHAGVIAVDINGDSALDLVTANLASAEVGVLLNNGSGVFALVSEPAVGVDPRSVAAADFNGDGKTDVAAANVGSDTISILIGNGDGTFQNQAIVAAGDRPRSLIAVDIDKNGMTDLITADSGDDTISILSGKGDGTFHPRVLIAVDDDPRAVVAADLNADGLLDLAVTSFSGNVVQVLRATGVNAFAGPVERMAIGGSYSIVAADFNADHRLDLATANFSLFNASVVLGRGGGLFHPQTVLSFPAIRPEAVAAGDFDRDGAMDLVLVGSNMLTIGLNLRPNRCAP